MNGSRKLSYCADSVRYTSNRPRPKITTDCVPAFISSSDCPAQAYDMPGGSVRSARSCIASSA